MPDLMPLAMEYGGYISIVKLIIFLGLFFLSLLLIGWTHSDAKAVGAKEVTWTGIILGSAATGIIIWLVVPIFIIGMLLYVIIVAGTSWAYVKHRNTRVLDYDRILTVDHIKGLLARKSEKLEAMQNFLFITANNNDVPLPEPKTPDFFGYRMAYDTLSDAKWRRASTVVFAPASQNYEVTYHIDGTAIKQPAIPKEQMDYFVRFIKHLADLDVNEKRKPQRGKFRTRQNKENTDWEVSTAGSTAGEQVRLRQITKESALRLGDLGLTADQYEQMSKFRELRQGLFVIAGPEKSGVTTTLYTLLRNHDAFTNSINTIEKQPSAALLNITQNTYSLSDTGTSTYAQRLATIIRMGPDIVGVGECEDSETAQAAAAAANDGKLVYVVLKADSVLQALGRWIKLVGDRKLVAATLLGISNQRLLRRLCEQCRQAYTPNTDLLKKFNLPADKAKMLYRPGREIYDKKGKPQTCPSCQGTGFVGRMGVFEVIIIDDELRKAVKYSKSLPEIGMQFRKAKMLYMQEQALRKVMTGTTAINEMLRVLSPSKGAEG